MRINITNLLAGLFLLFSAATGAQELTAEVDREVINLNDTLTLIIRQSGRNADSEPDFSLLRPNFEILNNQRSHQMQIINGKMDSTTEWRLLLSPKQTGGLIIPAFELDGETTRPITVEVVQQRQTPDGGGQEIFIQTKLDKKAAYVQEQVLFTIRLYSQVNLEGAEIQPLELPDTVVKAVDENNYITEINNRQHLVLETTLALFPQKSGKLEIPALGYEVAVSGGQRSPWGRSQRRRLRSEPLSLEVQPAPDSFTGEHWLPAKKLRLTQHWSRDPSRLTQGEPVTRRITLEAEGLTATQLPELTIPAAPGVNSYPDRPQTQEQIDAQGVRSSSTLTLALVPNQSGRITLPPVTLSWWDTENGRMRTAELPATQLQVKPDPSASTSQAEQTREQDDNAGDTSAQASPDGNATSAQPGPWLWLSALANLLLLALCIWLALWVHQLRAQLQALTGQQQETQRQHKAALGKAWQTLKRASRDQDLPKLRQALLNWGRIYWPEQPPQALTDIGERLASETLTQHLRQLDAQLYGGQSETPLDCQALVQELNHCRQSRRRNQKPQPGLAPLYGKDS